MKHAEVETVVPPPPPPPPPPLPNFLARRVDAESSVTNREIARFWRQKRIEEEDHLLAAIKAAARVRARKLSEDDYKRFIESLEDVNGGDAKENNSAASNIMRSHAKEEREVRIGIKDWWTKSNYAYLNQPALEYMDHPRRTPSYTPNCFSYKPVPLYPTSLGVF